LWLRLLDISPRRLAIFFAHRSFTAVRAQPMEAQLCGHMK